MVLLFPVSIKWCASTRSIWPSKMASHHQNVPYVLILSRAAVKCQRAVFSLLNRGVWAAGLKSTTGDFSVSQARRLCSCSVDGCLFICVNGFSGCQVLHLKPQKCSGGSRGTGVVMGAVEKEWVLPFRCGGKWHLCMFLPRPSVARLVCFLLPWVGTDGLRWELSTIPERNPPFLRWLSMSRLTWDQH